MNVAALLHDAPSEDRRRNPTEIDNDKRAPRDQQASAWPTHERKPPATSTPTPKSPSLQAAAPLTSSSGPIPGALPSSRSFHPPPPSRHPSDPSNQPQHRARGPRTSIPPPYPLPSTMPPPDFPRPPSAFPPTSRSPVSSYGNSNINDPSPMYNGPPTSSSPPAPTPPTSNQGPKRPSSQSSSSHGQSSTPHPALPSSPAMTSQRSLDRERDSGPIRSGGWGPPSGVTSGSHGSSTLPQMDRLRDRDWERERAAEREREVERERERERQRQRESWDQKDRERELWEKEREREREREFRERELTEREARERELDWRWKRERELREGRPDDHFPPQSSKRRPSGGSADMTRRSQPTTKRPANDDPRDMDERRVDKDRDVRREEDPMRRHRAHSLSGRQTPTGGPRNPEILMLGPPSASPGQGPAWGLPPHSNHPSLAGLPPSGPSGHAYPGYDRERDRDRDHVLYREREREVAHRDREREREDYRERERRDRERLAMNGPPHTRESHNAHGFPPGPPPHAHPHAHLHGHHAPPTSRQPNPRMDVPSSQYPPPHHGPPLPHMTSDPSGRSDRDPQRHFQNQFPTQFVSILQQGPPVSGSPSHSGSRLGSPTPAKMLPQEMPRERERDRERRDRDRKDKDGHLVGVNGSSRLPGSSRRPPPSSGQYGRDVYGRERRDDRDRNRRPPYAHPDQELMDMSGSYAPGHHRQPIPIVPEIPEEREFKAKTTVNIGTFVFPKLPFPYFFNDDPTSLTTLKGKEKENTKAKEIIDLSNDTPEKKLATAAPTTNGTSDLKISYPLAAANGSNTNVNGKESTTVNGTATKPSTSKPTTDNTDELNLLERDTRCILYFPSAYIPSARPAQPRIWGGGLAGYRPDAYPVPPRRRLSVGEVDTPQVAPRRRRRVYTDDSDIIICALHAGFISWSGVRHARETGLDLKLDIRIIKCLDTAGEGIPLHNQHSLSDPDVTVRSNKRAKTRKAPSGHDEVVGRFLGGLGERYLGPTSSSSVKKDTEGDVEMALEDKPDDDGRSLLSCGWGSGHDGSAIEIVGAEFVPKGTVHGLGRPNRAQRLLEYQKQRTATFGLPTSSSALGKRKGRSWDRPDGPPTQAHVPNATVLDTVNEEEEEGTLQTDRIFAIQQQKDEALAAQRTVVFGPGSRPWFKYDPTALREALLHPASEGSSGKRRKLDEGVVESNSSVKAVIVEAEKECHILSPLSDGDGIKLTVYKHDGSELDGTGAAVPKEDNLLATVSSVDCIAFNNEDLRLTTTKDGEVEQTELVIPVKRWRWAS